MGRKTALVLALVLAAGTAMGVDFSYRSWQGNLVNHTVFASGFQRFARLKNNDNSLNTRYNPTAGAVGYIYSREYWQAGLSFSYEHGSRKYDTGDRTMKVRSETPGFTLFGRWVNPDGLYVDGSTFLGFSETKSRNYRNATGSYGGSNTNHNTLFGASLEVGKSFVLPSDLVLTPHVGLDYAHSPSEKYWYNGQNVGMTNQDFWEIPVGLGISRTFLCGDWAITPNADVALITSLGHMDGMNYYPGFASRSARDWRVYGVSGDHLGGRVSTGVNAKLGDRTSLDLDYSFEGRSGYRDHRISAMFGWSF